MTSNTVTEFKAHILVTSNEFANHQALKNGNIANNDDVKEEEEIKWFQVGKGLKMDFMRRIPYYLDDYKDGLIGPAGTVQKTVATTFFLYFSVILPAVALGVLNSYNTHGEISVYQVIISTYITFKPNDKKTFFLSASVFLLPLFKVFKKSSNFHFHKKIYFGF